jgi:hypothetical protein
MTNQSSQHPKAVWLLIVLLFLLALGALPSGVLMMAAPDGSFMNMPLSMLQYSPFSSFFIPGLILFTLMGVYPLAVAYSLWRQPSWRWPEALNPVKGRHWSWAASLAAGVMLVIWITVQVLLLRSVAFLHVLYFIWGWALILLTLSAPVRQYTAR